MPTLALDELQVVNYRLIDQTENALAVAWIPDHKYKLAFTLKHTNPNRLYWFADVDLRIAAPAADVQFSHSEPANQQYGTIIPLIRNGEGREFNIPIFYTGSTSRDIRATEFDFGLYALRYEPKQAWKKFGSDFT